jgi:hypothetical protein
MSSIADTIRDQIGNRALWMIGARDLTGNTDGLHFRIMRNDRRVTHIDVTLDPDDTYTVRFLRVGRRRGVATCDELARYSDVYCDMLRSIINKGTGLAVSL